MANSRFNSIPGIRKLWQPRTKLEEKQQDLSAHIPTFIPEDQSLLKIGCDRDNLTKQLLGMKGANVQKTSTWRSRLQLMKPITWIAPMWAVVCGAASSGSYTWTWENFLVVMACMLLTGPLMTGYAQTLNDFYDKELDAINEPYRPIPSGAISIAQALAQIWVLLIVGLGMSIVLDYWAGHSFPIITEIVILSALIGYIYTAPPLKLKRTGWLSNYALGAGYIALPWWVGHTLFARLTSTIIFLTLFYNLVGWGIAVVNDFKSVEGDAKLGMKSLPVIFGANDAAWIAAAAIDISQIGIVLYLALIGQILYSVTLGLLIIPQIILQGIYLLRDPLKNDVKYQASAQPFLVIGMLIVGLAIGQLGS